MDASLFQFRGGVRSLGKKKLVDGNEYELFYKARTPSDVSGFRAGFSSFPDTEQGGIEREQFLTKFIAAAMCNEDGSALFTPQQAALVPDTLKTELALLIVRGSSSLDPDLGKD
jgi:hypothetical protein